MPGAEASVTSALIESADRIPIAYTTHGAGEGIIVLGGALRAGRGYLPLARALARSFAVHVMDRRGRGGSGPQGPDYSIDVEVEDLLALQRATGSAAVFGHSYGGLIALEAARRTQVFSRVAVYEPGVSIRGSIPLDWMPRYRELLAAGDERGAFAWFVRQSGASPLTRMPTWYVRAILRVVVRERRWADMQPLLRSNLREHEQVARTGDLGVDRFASITARVLLLGGSRSPTFLTTALFDALGAVITDASVAILPGLDHLAPDEKAPEVVAERVRAFLAQVA